jgi:hypothetical protein
MNQITTLDILKSRYDLMPNAKAICVTYTSGAAMFSTSNEDKDIAWEQFISLFSTYPDGQYYVYLKTTEKASNTNSSKDLVQKGELQGNAALQHGMAAVGSLHATPHGAYITYKDHKAEVDKKDAEIKTLEKETRKQDLALERQKLWTEHSKAIGKLETAKGIDWATIIPVAINALTGNPPTAQVGVAGLEQRPPRHTTKATTNQQEETDEEEYEEEDYTFDTDSALELLAEMQEAANCDIIEVLTKLRNFVVKDPTTAMFMLGRL